MPRERTSGWFERFGEGIVIDLSLLARCPACCPATGRARRLVLVTAPRGSGRLGSSCGPIGSGAGSGDGPGRPSPPVASAEGTYLDTGRHP